MRTVYVLSILFCAILAAASDNTKGISGLLGGGSSHGGGGGGFGGLLGGAKPFSGNKFQPHSTVSFAFRRWKISPDFIPEAPRGLLEVVYDNSVKPYLGSEVPAYKLADEPKLSWNCHPKKLYTVTLIDLYPVGPTCPELLAEGRLWLVVDIPGCKIDKGLELFEYQQPLPLYGSGVGRYLILVYEQPPYDIPWDEPFVSSTSEKYRYYTDVSKFAVQYDLGDPIAGNFFESQWDNEVDKVNDALDDDAPEYIQNSVDRCCLPPSPNEKNTSRVKKPFNCSTVKTKKFSYF